eukprot:gene28246-31349_t
MPLDITHCGALRLVPMQDLYDATDINSVAHYVLSHFRAILGQKNNLHSWYRMALCSEAGTTPTHALLFDDLSQWAGPSRSVVLEWGSGKYIGRLDNNAHLHSFGRALGRAAMPRAVVLSGSRPAEERFHYLGDFTERGHSLKRKRYWASHNCNILASQFTYSQWGWPTMACLHCLIRTHRIRDFVGGQ